MDASLPFEKNFIDLELDLDITPSQEMVDLVYPHVYVDKELSPIEIEHLFITTNKKHLNDDNSMLLYYKEGSQIEVLGRLYVGGLSSVLSFKVLDIPLYLKTSVDSDPIDMTEIESLMNLVHIIEE